MGKRPHHRRKVLCSKCKRNFGSEHAVWTHIAFQHPAAAAAAPPTTTLSTGRRRVAVKESATAAPPIVPVFTCTGCDIRFETDSDLSTHLDTIEQENKNDISTHEEQLQPENNSKNSSLNSNDDSKNCSIDSDKQGVEDECVKSTCSSYKIFCALCRKRFNTENALWTHMAFKHVRNNPSDSTSLTARFICDNCKQVFDTVQDITNHCHKQSSGDEKLTRQDSSKDIEDANESKSSNATSNHAKSHSPNKNSPSKSSKGKEDTAVPKIPVHSTPKKSSSSNSSDIKTLEDSFEGQEGIQVVYDDDNDDFDDFEDEEYSKIDDILESSKECNTASITDEIVSESPEISNKVDNNAKESDQINKETIEQEEPQKAIRFQLPVDETAVDETDSAQQVNTSDEVIENHEDCYDNKSPTNSPKKLSNSLNISRGNDNEDLDTSTSSKDVSLTDLFDDDLAGIENKLMLMSTMFTNELLSSRVRYLESKVVELQEYMTRLLEEEEQEKTDNFHRVSKRESTPPALLPPPSSPPQTTSIPPFTELEDHDKTSISTPLQCDKIESTTTEELPLLTGELSPVVVSSSEPYEVPPGEYVTFASTADDSVCEVEVNTSRSDEGTAGMVQTEVTGDNDIVSGGGVDTIDCPEGPTSVDGMTNIIFNDKPQVLGCEDVHMETSNCNDINSSQDMNSTDLSSAIQSKVNSLAQDFVDTQLSLDMEHGDNSLANVAIIHNGVGAEGGDALAINDVANMLTDDCVESSAAACMDDDSSMDAVLLEQIRNGCISSQELDSLFTTVANCEVDFDDKTTSLNHCLPTTPNSTTNHNTTSNYLTQQKENSLLLNNDFHLSKSNTTPIVDSSEGLNGDSSMEKDTLSLFQNNALNNLDCVQQSSVKQQQQKAAA